MPSRRQCANLENNWGKEVGCFSWSTGRVPLRWWPWSSELKSRKESDNCAKEKVSPQREEYAKAVRWNSCTSCTSCSPKGDFFWWVIQPDERSWGAGGPHGRMGTRDLKTTGSREGSRPFPVPPWLCSQSQLPAPGRSSSPVSSVQLHPQGGTGLWSHC